MGLADGAACEKENEFWISKANEDKRKAFYSELRNDIASIKNTIWNNKVDVIFDNYDYSLYKEKINRRMFYIISSCIIRIEKFCKYVWRKDISKI